jgi:hypothetical protein
MFRGSELSRLFVLLAILAAGWPMVLYYATRRPASVKPLPAKPAEALPPADTSPEFLGIQDKSPLSARENPAYITLLERARSTPAKTLAAESLRDVLYSQIIQTPERFRGLPIHIEGTARRIVFQDVVDPRIFPKGRFYEAYVFTPDSQKFPYILVFEDAPEGFKPGKDIYEPVSFDGYFFKLMLYRAGDVPRFAPLLVGRVTTVPGAGRAAAPSTGMIRSEYWPVLILVALTIYLGFRFYFQLRKSADSRRPATYASRPSGDIDSEALGAWLSGGSTSDGTTGAIPVTEPDAKSRPPAGETPTRQPDGP